MKLFLWIVTILYFFFAWWWYVCPHKKVCPFGTKHSINSISTPNPNQSLETKPLTGSPVIDMDKGLWNDAAKDNYAMGWPLFKWGSEQPIVPPGFFRVRDSLVQGLSDQNLLRIAGFHYAAEEKHAESDDLGLSRSEEIKNLFDGFISMDRIITSSEKRIDSDTSYLLSPARAYDVKIMVQNDIINEISDKTIIYFPYASADMLENEKLMAYLDQVVDRVKNSEEKIKLVGHTDSLASVARNMYLGKIRAEKIQAILVQKGIDKDKIIVESKGESEPIATNNTQNGRQKNRRVELSIISSF